MPIKMEIEFDFFKETKRVAYSFPIHAFDIHKQPHQLGHSHGRMSIIQLNGHLFWHFSEIRTRNFARTKLGMFKSGKKKEKKSSLEPDSNQ